MQGRGEPTTKDIILGVTMFVFCFVLVLLGILNVYIVLKVETFHNAFGWFWLTRTGCELISNIAHIFYTAPVTIFQPRNIPISVGFGTYFVSAGSVFAGCLVHLAVSINRFIAVYRPLQYKFIFSKGNCIKIIAISILPVVISIILHLILPCNTVAYSPVMYDYTVLSDKSDICTNYIQLTTVLNSFCVGICIITIIIDLSTLCKIVHIRMIRKAKKDDKLFLRDIRFFIQASLQNVTMAIATAFITTANNHYSVEGEVTRLVGFYSVLAAHLCNTLSLIVFNPEVRRRLFSPKISYISRSPVPFARESKY
uniref:G_PROTEIN_RECEP_F1_2 domain-containing protein n=1 Tax=Steinernema glaseri TaxID=37863 RepID=A0A1I8AUQ1_9BILA